MIPMDFKLQKNLFKKKMFYLHVIESKKKKREKNVLSNLANLISDWPHSV